MPTFGCLYPAIGCLNLGCRSAITSGYNSNMSTSTLKLSVDPPSSSLLLLPLRLVPWNSSHCHVRSPQQVVNAIAIRFLSVCLTCSGRLTEVWVHIGRMTFDLGFPEYLTAGYNMVFTSMHVIVMLGSLGCKGPQCRFTCAVEEAIVEQEPCFGVQCGCQPAFRVFALGDFLFFFWILWPPRAGPKSVKKWLENAKNGNKLKNKKMKNEQKKGKMRKWGQMKKYNKTNERDSGGTPAGQR